MHTRTTAHGSHAVPPSLITDWPSCHAPSPSISLPPPLPLLYYLSRSLPSRCMRTWQPHTCVPGSGSSGCPTTHTCSSVQFAAHAGAVRPREHTVAQCSYSYGAAAIAATAHGIPGSPAIRVKLRVRVRLRVRVGVGVSSRGRGQGLRVRVRVTLRPRLRRPDWRRRHRTPPPST